jgi:hypothetical protein
LPGANSTAWHHRRVFDSLGYYRARTMANPNARPDPDYLARWLKRERDLGTATSLGPCEEDMPFLDAALLAVARYRSTPAADQSAAWDDVLEAVDALLEVRQNRHLREVNEAAAEDSDS